MKKYFNFTAKNFQELLSFYSIKKSTTIEEIIKNSGQTLEGYIKHDDWKGFEKELQTLKVNIIKNAGHRTWMDNPSTFKNKLNKSLNRK